MPALPHGVFGTADEARAKAIWHGTLWTGGAMMAISFVHYQVRTPSGKSKRRGMHDSYVLIGTTAEDEAKLQTLRAEGHPTSGGPQNYQVVKRTAQMLGWSHPPIINRVPG